MGCVPSGFLCGLTTLGPGECLPCASTLTHAWAWLTACYNNYPGDHKGGSKYDSGSNGFHASKKQ